MSDSIQILLLEDNLNDAELVNTALEAAGLTCEIARVDTEAAFSNALNGAFDLIISDYTLPSFNGQRALTIARERCPDIPFIFVSGSIGEEAAIESLLAGATDYVLKHKFARLVPAVRRALHEAEERRARREAEQKLETTLAQLRNLFDNLDDVFFSFDPRSDRLLQVSPACEQVYGLPQQAFFDNPHFWKQVCNGEDLPTVESAGASLQAGHAVSFEYRIRRSDGMLRWVQAKMKPVSESSGHIIRVDGIISDITERKELEAQSLRAQRMESLGNLAGGIAHDLNNVLSPIMMGVGILREEYKDSKAQTTLATMALCAQRGANLVKQILMFARGVEGRRVSIHVGRLIGESERMLRQTFPKSVQIVTEVPSELWSVFADKTHLEQVLMNLCVNSRDAMPNGGVLKIAARNAPGDSRGGRSAQASPGPHVVIEVSDTGQGIPSENLDKIFDPFFTTKGAGTGTGLGLSTVYAIVKSHGGFVNVESAVGRGTTFQVCLSALPAVVDRDEETKGGAFPVGNGELVLVVDDEAAVCDFTRTILGSYGYRVLVAADGTEGVIVYSKNADSISLVLTDLDMPKMGGAEMIRLLQEINSDVRVISTTGLIDGEGFGQVEAGPVRAVLQKPFSPIQLLKSVQNVLRPS